MRFRASIHPIAMKLWRVNLTPGKLSQGRVVVEGKGHLFPILEP